MYIRVTATLSIALTLHRELERQSLPNAVPTAPPSNTLHSGPQRGTAEKPHTLTSISVRERAQQSLDNTERHLKAIDVRFSRSI